ncbi:MAG TPA: hypothetical protein ENI17_00390 [Pseudomonas xinjiangensis]|uniref:Uncharacterized protein n=2 Tax=root TaxID=1 RepID=A0A7V1BLU9_9GAMM|nr:hypothetical protein [Halopseudomonas xinjiangensis]HEC46080.1 hypothetical protein [Halopseudomonas xinjiangensis]
MSPRIALRIGTVLATVVLGFFALGKWMAQQDAPRALDWKAQYQESLWGPLQQGALTLAGVNAVLGTGTLWMISSDGEPLLVSRHPLESDALSWRLQAVITLDEQRTASLVEAQAWTPESPDQPVNPAVGEALADYPVARMSLIPAEPVDVSRIYGSFGNPDVRMDVSDGNQAWVYARNGVVVAVTGEQAHSIMFGLKREL